MGKEKGALLNHETARLKMGSSPSPGVQTGKYNESEEGLMIVHLYLLSELKVFLVLLFQLISLSITAGLRRKTFFLSSDEF